MFGWAQSFAGPVPHFVALGLPLDEAEHLAREVDSVGGILVRMKVDPKVAALITSLHTNSWISYDDLDQTILVARGGRQGCKLGGMVFNFAYASALKDLQQRLADAGVLTRLPLCPGQPPWADPRGSDVEATVFDATFVDDEAKAVATMHGHLSQAS